MNGKSIVRVLLVAGLAKAVFGGHRHGMAGRHDKVRDRIVQMHREFHRRDAELSPEIETTA